jgi:hypothetical protein
MSFLFDVVIIEFARTYFLEKTKDVCYHDGNSEIASE